jgi:hypothetical protein
MKTRIRRGAAALAGGVLALALAATGCNYSRTPSKSNSGTEDVRGTGGSGINPAAPSGAYGTNKDAKDQSAMGQGNMQQAPARTPASPSEQRNGTTPKPQQPAAPSDSPSNDTSR